MRLFRLRVECRMIEVKNMIKQRGYRRLKEMLETPTSAYDRYKGVGQALKMSDCPYGKAGSNCSGIIGEEPGEDLRTLHVEKTTRGSSFERVIGLDEYWHLKAQHYETTESHEDIKALDFLSKYREIQEPVLRSSLTFPCAASSIHTETMCGPCPRLLHRCSQGKNQPLLGMFQPGLLVLVQRLQLPHPTSCLQMPLRTSHYGRSLSNGSRLS
jgi:hypothetical protein